MYDTEKENIKQWREPSANMCYSPMLQIILKSFKDGRIESNDHTICFYPFKEKLSKKRRRKNRKAIALGKIIIKEEDEKVSILSSDTQSKYLVCANSKGILNVYLLSKLQKQKDTPYAKFTNHVCQINQILLYETLDKDTLMVTGGSDGLICCFSLNKKKLLFQYVFPNKKIEHLLPSLEND